MAVDTLVSLADGVTKAIVLLSGLLGVIFICWAGIQFITSSGDPQKVAQARMSLFGALIGMVVCGVAFVVPRIIGDIVMESAGGTPILMVEEGVDCDGYLRRQLVVQHAASDTARMQAVVRYIQATISGCGSEVWSPVVLEPAASLAGHHHECFERDPGDDDRLLMGGMRVPEGLTWNTLPRRWSSRDADNNILVYWSAGDGLPSDQSHCWIYVSQYGIWGLARAEFSGDLD